MYRWKHFKFNIMSSWVSKPTLPTPPLYVRFALGNTWNRKPKPCGLRHTLWKSGFLWNTLFNSTGSGTDSMTAKCSQQTRCSYREQIVRCCGTTEMFSTIVVELIWTLWKQVAPLATTDTLKVSYFHWTHRDIATVEHNLILKVYSN